MVLYQVFGLETLGNLFPNLARIRGNSLLNNYALIVYDVSDLREVGLHNLLKIDRGGVIIWGNPLTCFVDTIDWDAIAPRSRHVLSIPDRQALCNFPCTCSDVSARNRCWNNRKCQRFLEGPEGEDCNSQCLGCRNTNHSSCSLCRNYSYRGECVPRCPDDTFILSASNYCITKAECLQLSHWIFNEYCVSECPEDYKEETNNGTVSCVFCKDCHLICNNLDIQSLSKIQDAERCVYVHGYLKIHIWSEPQIVDELNYYLKNIEEVSDYVLIYSSMQITSLHFLSSLKRIKGEKLYNGSYSFVVHNMQNLQSLFLPNVTQNLKVDNGFLGIYQNRMLCMTEIEKLKSKFPIGPPEIDVYSDRLNGYGAGCGEISANLTIDVKNETFAIATFYPSKESNVHYSLLYVKISHGSHISIVPESCSDAEWSAVDIQNTNEKAVKIELSALKPATTYAVCIEKYNTKSRHLARSNITNFTTAVGKPELPFILELVASSFNAIVIRWVNHLDYRPFITKYELDVILVDIDDRDISVRDHCVLMDDDLFEIDYSRHAKVMRPPNNYEKGCESTCGILSSVTKGSMVEEYFDVCSVINGCDYENDRPGNSSYRDIIQSLILDLIDHKNNSYQVADLLPYRDYRFHLRACTADHCSRSARGVVRTLRLDSADVASITVAKANKSGYIDVKWNPPLQTNGPLLSNTIEVYSDAQIYDIKHLLPQTLCVPGNATSSIMKSKVAEKYLIRICTTTLGNTYICSEWKKVLVSTENESSWWWYGMLLGIILPMFSCILGWHLTVRIKETENIPLVDATFTMRQESEAPATMFTDFMPSNYIALSNLHFK
ncbi:insulin-like growth factor 1 receptor isoform X2 [Bicyclus anynana]|nr:insulin-like growth factor 1 receptor isoform X2 [Bicyclus anynana]